MIHIDNLDGEGTIFMSTDDGTQSIGHVEKEYASILQDVLESYDWYVKEAKRLREQNQLMLDYFWFMRNGGFTDADDLLITINKWIDEEE